MESISEAKVSTLHFFDIDETVFNTFAKIIVRDKDTGDEIAQLTNQQFNSYKLKDNEEFDFNGNDGDRCDEDAPQVNHRSRGPGGS